jgi:hypothetical protein
MFEQQPSRYFQMGHSSVRMMSDMFNGRRLLNAAVSWVLMTVYRKILRSTILMVSGYQRSRNAHSDDTEDLIALLQKTLFAHFPVAPAAFIPTNEALLKEAVILE